MNFPPMSPRGTIERHRSPQEGDIKMGFNEPLLVNRSSQNSLIPDDPYRSSNNGFRRSRNSLAPGMGTSIDASMMANQRSPRKSSPHLNRSRQSLVSENENLALKSPRHSLVPTSSRYPYGSTMELTAPQTRGNRSPRGSIGMNEYNGRNNIEPPISRTPRGSLGALPDESVKKNVIVQDPRHDSPNLHACPPRRNSSPYREKTKQKIEKSEPNKHLTQEYGMANFEDYRRVSSSAVSQFSGDGTRFFHNGIKMPTERLDTNTYTAITYGSVVFQLKDANVEAKNIVDFAFRAFKIVYKTRIATAILILLCILPVAMLIIGWQYFGDCRVKEEIPFYMITVGVFGAIYMFAITYFQIRSRRVESLTVHPSSPEKSFATVTIVALSIMLFISFIMGNIWIFDVMWPSFKEDEYNRNEYCTYSLYMLAVIHLYVIYGTFTIIIVVMIVMAVLRVIGWWSPGR